MFIDRNIMFAMAYSQLNIEEPKVEPTSTQKSQGYQLEPSKANAEFHQVDPPETTPPGCVPNLCGIDQYHCELSPLDQGAIIAVTQLLPTDVPTNQLINLNPNQPEGHPNEAWGSFLAPALVGPEPHSRELAPCCALAGGAAGARGLLQLSGEWMLRCSHWWWPLVVNGCLMCG